MLVFLRHADSTGQAPDAPLTAQGQADALALVPRLARLGITHIWSSPFVRARETVRPFAEQAGLTVQCDPRLEERRHGPVPEGQWAEEARALFADPDARPWDGESRNDVLARGKAMIADIETQGTTPLVACHGFWLSCVLTLYGAPGTEAAWRALPRPAVICADPNTGVRHLL